LDNADAVMLSAETASGDNPALVVETMAKICHVAEQQPTDIRLFDRRLEAKFHRVDEAIALAAVYTANHLNIEAIITLTESGTTPLWMSRIHSATPIYGLSRNAKTLGKMALYRRVSPINFDVTDCKPSEINHAATQALVDLKLLQNGDLVLFTQGDRPGQGGGTNAMKILTVGDIA